MSVRFNSPEFSEFAQVLAKLAHYGYSAVSAADLAQYTLQLEGILARVKTHVWEEED